MKRFIWTATRRAIAQQLSTRVSPLSLLVGASLMCNIASAQLLDHAQIDEGFRIFTEEDWNGNGRTCGTCHIPDESYNIFPETINNLSQDEKDLVLATNVPGLENPDLVEQHALFNIMGSADADCGADDPECWPNSDHPGPVFRSTMGIFALDLTTTTPPMDPDGTFPGTPLVPDECNVGVGGQLPQLGWSGDGSPGTPAFVDDGSGNNLCNLHHGQFDGDADGSIRAFANGAIAQHSTLSLNRVPDVDFRFADGDELDALEAFQRWLGRRALTDEENATQGTADAVEFDLARLDFKDRRVALGRDHYVGGPIPFAELGRPFEEGDGAGCNVCHANGGSTAVFSPPIPVGSNINLNTEVELASDDIGEDVAGSALPHDEGACSPFVAPCAFENFNTQSVIESAQKKAWFHNHKAVDDFEEAVLHYASDDFINGALANELPHSPVELLEKGNGVSVRFRRGDGIEHLGTFLRALNAFYNLRDCERLIDEAIERIGLDLSVENPVNHCRFHLSHVTRILREAKHRRLHIAVQRGAPRLARQLEGLKKRPRVARLERIKGRVRNLRDSIAMQVEVAVVPEPEPEAAAALAEAFANATATNVEPEVAPAP